MPQLLNLHNNLCEWKSYQYLYTSNPGEIKEFSLSQWSYLLMNSMFPNLYAYRFIRLWTYYELTNWPSPSWFDSSVGWALLIKLNIDVISFWLFPSTFWSGFHLAWDNTDYGTCAGDWRHCPRDQHVANMWPACDQHVTSIPYPIQKTTPSQILYPVLTVIKKYYLFVHNKMIVNAATLLIFLYINVSI